MVHVLSGLPGCAGRGILSSEGNAQVAASLGRRVRRPVTYVPCQLMLNLSSAHARGAPNPFILH